jgi:pimeloyl-ACP methyl ester carboxylesterase
MSVLLLDRQMVHYEVLGRGRPVLLLHGWVGSWRYWIPVMQAASISYRTYALDQWGYGDSSKPADHYTLARQIGLIDTFLEQMGILKLALIGHGLGAVLALKYAALHPEAVDRVMAVSMPLEEAALAPRLRTAGPGELAEWLVGRTAQSDAIRAEVPKIDPQAHQTIMEALAGVELEKLWKETRRPCLLVHGANDPAVLAPRPEQISDLPYLVHAVTFEQSGHFPMIDEDNKFHRLVIDFLSLQTGDSPRELQLKEEWKRRVR